MKKIFSIFLVIILVLSGFMAVANTNNMQDINVKRDSKSFSKINFEKKGEYLNVHMVEATSRLMDAGKPILPVITKTFTFPFGTRIVDVDVFYEMKSYILTKKIQPTPVNASKLGKILEMPSEKILDQTVYGSSEFYPKQPYTITKGTGLSKNEHVLFLTIKATPQYSPECDILLSFDEMEIEIEYILPKTPLFANDVYDMVIIAPNEFSSNILPLIDHKNSRGTQTVLKTTEEIYEECEGRDEIEQIKYFIKNAVENWNITFVLLVGGSERLPARYSHIYFDDFYLYPIPEEWIFPSDLYYADIYDCNGNFSSWDTNENNVFAEYNWYGNTDELDLYPDVYLGRLACVSKDEVDICVNKIITYEVEEAYTQDWFTDLVVIGGDSLPGDEEKVDEGEYVHEHVIEILDGFRPIKIWASNGKLSDAANIDDAINNGAGFVFFNGHGNLDLWGTHPHENDKWIPTGFYRNSNVIALSNGNKLPIIISDACYHCSYHKRSDCFGWNFITNPNGGAIAYLGGTDVDLSYGGTDIITKGVEKICLKLSSHYINGTRTFGKLWGDSITSYISSSIMDEIDLINIEESQPFGDPSLEIAGKSMKPEKPDAPEGPSMGKINEEYTYTASTTDPDGDELYYMFDWGDEAYSEWIGPYSSGETVEASHTWTEKENYEMRVKAKDEHGIQSDWSDSLSVSMPKNKAISNDLAFLRILEDYPFLFPLIRFLMEFKFQLL